jgi:hypothetical protein
MCKSPMAKSAPLPHLALGLGHLLRSSGGWLDYG